jgi:hypothetical protein
MQNPIKLGCLAPLAKRAGWRHVVGMQKPLDMTINLDRLRSVRLKLRRGLVKLTMCSAVGLDERYKKKKKKKLIIN